MIHCSHSLGFVSGPYFVQVQSQRCPRRVLYQLFPYKQYRAQILLISKGKARNAASLNHAEEILAIARVMTVEGDFEERRVEDSDVAPVGLVSVGWKGEVC
jgi:hypothetical protein